MLESAAILLSLGQILFDYRIRSPFILFSVSFFAAVVSPVILIIKNSSLFSDSYLEGIAYIVLFQLIYLTCSIVFRRRKLSHIWNLEYCVHNANELRWAYLISISLALCFFVYGISQFNLLKLVYLSWWDVVHSESIFTLLGSYFLYAASSILLIQKGTKSHALLGMAILFLIFALFILKTRGYVIALLSPLILYYLFNQKERKSRQLLRLFGISCFAIFAFIFTRMIRHGGDLYSTFAQGNEGLSSLFESAVSDGSEFSLVNAFFYFIKTNFSTLPDGFGEFHTLRRLVFFFLPTGAFELKPQEFSYVMHVGYYGGSMGDGLSMHPTIVGDAYANGKLVGIVIYPVLISIFFSTIERFIFSSKSALLLIGPTCFLSIYIARGAVYNGFVFFIGASLLIYFFIHIARIRGK